MSLVRNFSQLRLSLHGKLYSEVEKRELLDVVTSTVQEGKVRNTLVIVSDENPLRFSFIFFALLDAGAVPVPFSHEMTHFQLESLRQSSENYRFMTNGILTPPKANENSLKLRDCYACATSGTTGRPKLCYLSTLGAKLNARAHAESFGICSEHTIFQTLPIYHSFGVVCYLWTALETGCALDFNSLSLSLKSLQKRGMKKGVLYLSPAQVRFFSKNPSKSPNDFIDIVSVGGGALQPGEIPSFESLFPTSKKIVSYGLTEAGPRVLSGRVEEAEREDYPYIGEALRGVELRIQLTSGVLAKEGEGVLCVKTPSLKLNSDKNEMAASDGSYFVTRDRVILKNYKVYFVSRDIDVIKVGGVSIYPVDIETVTRRLEGVVDCLVAKILDAVYQEVPILFVEGMVDRELVSEFLRERLLPIQFPRKIFVLERFPRQGLNKIDRRLLFQEVGLTNDHTI